MQGLLGYSQELKSYSKSNGKPLKALKLARVMEMEMKRGGFKIDWGYKSDITCLYISSGV